MNDGIRIFLELLMEINMKNIKDYLKNKETVLIQTKINSDLHEEINNYRESLQITWKELLEACFKKVLDESILEKKRAK